MLHQARERDVERVGQLAEGGRSVGQTLQDVPARRVRQGRERAIQRRRLYHLVNRSRGGPERSTARGAPPGRTNRGRQPLKGRPSPTAWTGGPAIGLQQPESLTAIHPLPNTPAVDRDLAGQESGRGQPADSSRPALLLLAGHWPPDALRPDRYRRLCARSGERSPTSQRWPNGSRKPPCRWMPHGAWWSRIWSTLPSAPAATARSMKLSGSSKKTSTRPSAAKGGGGVPAVVGGFAHKERGALHGQPYHLAEVPQLGGAQGLRVAAAHVGDIAPVNGSTTGRQTQRSDVVDASRSLQSIGRAGDRRSPSPSGRITPDTRVIITQLQGQEAAVITRVSPRSVANSRGAATEGPLTFV